MLNSNPGIDRLLGTVEHLLSMGLDCTDFRDWSAARLDAVRGAIDEHDGEPAVRGFISDYAGSLADELFDFISEGDPVTALESAPDYLEELASQVSRFASALAEVPAGAHVDEDQLADLPAYDDYEDFLLAETEEMAQAA